jgi:hypothetical protein
VSEKGYLAQIVESLVDLCIILIDIISLAFLIEESLRNAQGDPGTLDRVRLAYQSLHYWHASDAPAPDLDGQERHPGIGGALRAPVAGVFLVRLSWIPYAA